MQETEQLVLMPDLFGAFSVETGSIAHGFFYLVVALAFLYTLVVAYHWIRYGHRSIVAIPALAAHAFASLALIGFAASGL